ncbi:hypothetical protein DPMN_136959 [Dreissena polymorpha]|uniref:Uncharacterized protein n=1 Tax=Dreissena polymorpha TaxID=45954 RepID=A0A9D4G1V5_DREPO|nr:hypothetical protein DPMN_136959 [Dreissena polymorpha]
MFPATPPPRACRRMTYRLLRLALIIIGVDVVHAHRVFVGVDLLVRAITPALWETFHQETLFPALNSVSAAQE